VRELLAHLAGEASLAEARNLIAVRTRRLARRQIRWFDKLTATLRGRARMQVVEKPSQISALNYMHDRIGV
jgi:tRNA dimethylallyltransferase